MVFEKFYNINLENPNAVLSTLERITDCHSYGSGVVFTFPKIRESYGQYPLHVKELKFHARSKKEINLNELRAAVKCSLEPTVILYRSTRYSDEYWAYFLPEAVNDDPSVRILRSGSTNINNH
jgi:hypothetical protein